MVRLEVGQVWENLYNKDILTCIRIETKGHSLRQGYFKVESGGRNRVYYRRYTEAVMSFQSMKLHKHYNTPLYKVLNDEH
jgi:hypothetical protein